MHNNKSRNNRTRKQILMKFSLKEFGGSLGDWGTLIPFIIGYVSIVGLNPAGIFFCLGITNIILGIKFNLPLPVQPQKTIDTIAISQVWSPNLVISTGFSTGIIWTILGFLCLFCNITIGFIVGLGLYLTFKLIENKIEKKQ